MTNWFENNVAGSGNSIILVKERLNMWRLASTSRTEQWSYWPHNHNQTTTHFSNYRVCLISGKQKGRKKPYKSINSLENYSSLLHLPAFSDQLNIKLRNQTKTTEIGKKTTWPLTFRLMCAPWSEGFLSSSWTPPAAPPPVVDILSKLALISLGFSFISQEGRRWTKRTNRVIFIWPQ